MRGYYIESFGCRAAQADSSAIERQLQQAGLHRVPTSEQAEVVVLNTCTVTSSADRDARAAVRRVHRESPNSKILVTGCYAQRAPDELAKLEGVTWVVGNSHKHLVGAVISDSRTSGYAAAFIPLSAVSRPDSASVYVADIFAHTQMLAAPVFEGSERTRPNLKVQDGCDNRCSFCVIPYVRGSSRSLPVEDVVSEMNALERAGYKEVVLSGINLGRWGREFQPAARFVDLVSTLIGRTSIEKIRISSVESMDWSEDLIALVAESPRIAKHAHVPLQSGSDALLRKMHRKYRPWHYAEKLEKIRRAMPDAAIGADVMTGFPGETETLFQESFDFIAQMPLTYLHVFTYSPRPGTPAASMEPQVPVHEARTRTRVLRALSAEKNLAFRRRFVGRRLSALTLGEQAAHSDCALSDNFLKIELDTPEATNQWLSACIERVTETGLRASVVPRS